VDRWESDYESDQSNYDDYLHNLKKKLKEIHGIAHKNLKQAAVYQKRHYDLKAKKCLFKKGQPVWTYEPARKVGMLGVVGLLLCQIPLHLEFLKLICGQMNDTPS
jgi:predicted transcriptional regulator